MNKFEIISKCAAVSKVHHLSAAGVLIDRKLARGNYPSAKHVLKQTARCLCGAHNVWLRTFHYEHGNAVGVICIKCSRTAVGSSLTLALLNWTERKLLFSKDGANA